MWSVANLPAFLCVAAVSTGLLLRTAQAHGDGHEAIATLTKEIENRPAEGKLYYERASLWVEHGEYAKALEDLDAVRKLDPANDLQTALRGSVLRRSGQPAAARTEQEAFLQKHPGHLQVRFEYCRTLIDLHDRPAALRELDAVIAAAENPSPDAVAMRLKATEESGDTGPAAALVWLDAFLVRHPLPVFQEEALRLELKLGRTPAAVQRLDTLIAKAPRPETLHLRKADILAAAGDKTGARTAAQAAMDAMARLPAHIRSNRACSDLTERARIHLQP